MPTRIGVLLAVLVQLAGCYGPVWPSRGMTVKLPQSGLSALDVKEFIERELLRQGFVDIGPDGRDVLDGTTRNFNFEGRDDLLVSVGVDSEREVAIRVSQNREAFTPEASQLYESLAIALDARWPGSVTREEATRP